MLSIMILFIKNIIKKSRVFITINFVLGRKLKFTYFNQNYLRFCGIYKKIEVNLVKLYVPSLIINEYTFSFIYTSTTERLKSIKLVRGNK